MTRSGAGPLELALSMSTSRRAALRRVVAGMTAGFAAARVERDSGQAASPRGEETTMTSYAFVIPILPGMEERDRQFGVEVSGPRRVEHAASRARLGITREEAWQQETAEGTVTIVYLEAEDVKQALTGIGTSQDPYDQWWREQIVAIHGIDPAQPVSGPSNRQFIDFRAE